MAEVATRILETGMIEETMVTVGTKTDTIVNDLLLTALLIAKAIEIETERATGLQIMTMTTTTIEAEVEAPGDEADLHITVDLRARK